MFDPATETNTSWDVEIKDDDIVNEECNNHGGILHVYGVKQSLTGNVYVECPAFQPLSSP